jgi:glutathione peroxidase
MVVNTASFCGFTPQFEDLQDLYEQYNQHNFEILGFPCYNFDNQDPGADSTILEFCTEEYGVTFQMMSKIKAVVSDTAPAFRWLQEEVLNGVADAPITWNFHKFLIDEAGHWVAHHSSLVNPMSSQITDWIMSPSALSVADAGPMTSAELIQITSSGLNNTLQLQCIANGTSDMTVELLSTDGKLVDVIHPGRMGSGETFSYPTASVSTGIYLIRATTNDAQQTLKYAVVR